MPLDPQIAALLDALNAAGGGDTADLSVEDARSGFHLLTVTMRDPATLAPVRSVEDSRIPGPAGEIPIRVYRPDVDGPVPTVAFFHGGGFVIGGIDTHEDQARLLCRDVGVVVVSVDYRLAPEHPFPAAFDDCFAATRWVAENLDTLGGDPRVVVGGDSAGGNLSAAVAIAARDADVSLAAQFLLYPAVDMDSGEDYPSRLENAEGYFLTLKDMIWFGASYVGSFADHRDPRLSPMHADLRGVAPAVVATAEFDPLRDEGEVYAKALADAGVEVHLHRYDGLVHGFYGFGVHSAGAAAAVTDVNAALASLLT